jgi:hypothetical protein
LQHSQAAPQDWPTHVHRQIDGDPSHFPLQHSSAEKHGWFAVLQHLGPGPPQMTSAGDEPPQHSAGLVQDSPGSRQQVPPLHGRPPQHSGSSEQPPCGCMQHVVPWHTTAGGC